LSVFGIALLAVARNAVLKHLYLSTFYVVIILLFLLLFSVLISTLCHADKRVTKFSAAKSFQAKSCKFIVYIIAFSVIMAFVVALFFDIFILNSMFFSTIILFIGLFVSFALTKYSYRLALFYVIFLFLAYIIAFYSFYPPILGTDTWRDCTIAFITIKNGSISGVGNQAYEIPIVPILYSAISLVLNISPIYASALIGILYMFIIASFAFLISRKISGNVNTVSSFLVVLLVVSIPLISIWSVGFVPEAYAFMIFLSLLLILFSVRSKGTKELMIALPLLFAIVLSHGGVDLYCIVFFAFLIIIMKLLNAKKNPYSFIKHVLLILILLTIVYFEYTTMLTAVTQGIDNIYNVILGFATSNTGASTPTMVSGGSSINTALLDYGPFAVCVAITTIAWLGNRRVSKSFNKIFLETVFLYSIIMITVSFLGLIYYPQGVLDRYLGFGSLLLLSIIASQGFRELLNRRLIGKVFVGLLALSLLFSICFGAVLTFNFNPFDAKNGYSVQSPPSWTQQASIDTIISHIDNGSVLADYKIGQLMDYSFLNVYGVQGFTSLYRGIELEAQEGNITTTNLGVYSLIATYGYISSQIDDGSLFIYRNGAFDNLNLLIGINQEQLYNTLLLNYDLVYNGPLEIIVK
jgi:hypothetical protein